MTAPRSRRLLADGALLAMVVVWGFTFVPIETIAKRDPQHTVTFVAARFWIAALGYLPLLWFARGPLATARRPGLYAALAMSGGYCFQTIGLTYTTSAKAGFLTGTSVVLVPFGALLLRRRVPPAAFLGLLVATPGMLLVTVKEDLGLGVGEVLVFCCAISFAAQILVTDRFAREVDPFAFSMWQALFTAIGTSVLAAWTEVVPHGPPSHGREFLFWATFCGLGATMLPFLVQTVAQRITSATHVAVIYASEPVFAAAFSWWLMGERFTGRTWAGAALILGGMLVAELGSALWARLAARRPA
jgi:drug/metabolite transporter (DMT)-like permease